MLVETDLLGAPYQRRVIDLGEDDEGPVVATLVSRPAREQTRRAVLWVHGFSDYFFQTHVADFFTDQGFDFYALDLRKYGRSLRAHQTPNFCRSLGEYDQELDQAARIIQAEGHDRLLVAAHSTGGLIAALWAHRRRGTGMVDGLFLNSPFFDLNVPPVLRAQSRALEWLGRHRPYGVLPKPTFPLYAHSLHVDFRGEWAYDLRWKPVGGFPVRYGWLAAVRAGQRRLYAGLSVDVPVLVGASTRSYRGRRWHELARWSDTVLDVTDIVRWAPHVGRHVTILRVDGGMHDLTLSAPPVRKVVFSELAQWTRTYLGAGAPRRRGKARAGKVVRARAGAVAQPMAQAGTTRPAPGPEAARRRGGQAAAPAAPHPVAPPEADPSRTRPAGADPAAAPPTSAVAAPADRD